MIPDAVGGLALLTLAWLALWWLVGGRKPLSSTCCTVGAIAWGVLALDAASIQHWSAVPMGLCALLTAGDAGMRRGEEARAARVGRLAAEGTARLAEHTRPTEETT